MKQTLALFVAAVCITAWIPLSVDIGGLNLRLSQMMLPIVGLLIATQASTARASWWSFVLVVCGGLWWISLLGWTLVAGGNLGKPLGRVLLIALNLVHALAFHLLVLRQGTLRPAMRAFFTSTTVLNLVLLAAAAATSFGLPMPAGWVSDEVAPLYLDGEIVGGTIQRFKFAGVLTGCVSAAACAMAACCAFDPGWKERRLLWWTGTTALAGMVIGFSRQNILSLILALAVAAPVLWLRVGTGRVIRMLTGTLVASVLALLMVTLTPGGRAYLEAFLGRAAQFGDSTAYREGTVGARAALWSKMLADVRINPLRGRGQDAYLRYMDANEAGSHNFAIEALHSTGLVGFLPYVMLHALPLLTGLALLLGSPMTDIVRFPLLAALCGYVAVVSASLSNLIYWNPVYWMLFAFLTAQLRLVDRSAVGPLRH